MFTAKKLVCHLMTAVVLVAVGISAAQTESEEKPAAAEGESRKSEEKGEESKQTKGSEESKDGKKAGDKKEKDQKKSADKEGGGDEEEEEDDEPYHFLPPITWGGPEGKDYKLQLGGDTRVRLETRDNYSGVLRTIEDDTFVSVRTRLNADLVYRDVVRAFVEVLDGRVWWNDYEYPQEAHFSPHQAFLDLGNAPKHTSWTLRLGRQEIELGRDRRLSEASNWNNLRRSFDGVRAMYRTKETDVDLFLTNTTTYNRVRNGRVVTERERTNEDEYFYGAYATLRQWDPHTIEAYFLGLSNTDREARSERGVLGTSDRYTVGSAFYGDLWKKEKCGTLGYGLEGGYQFGHHSEDEIRAYFLHADFWYEWDHDWKPRLTLLGNLASGDREEEDGETNTFRPLFGASHGPYGIMDFVRLQNLRELALQGRVNPTKKLTLELEYHTFWRDSTEDDWYDAAGTAVGSGPGSHIGQEISAVAEYAYSKCMTLEGGVAHFFPGTADRDAGNDRSANFFYVQTVIRF